MSPFHQGVTYAWAFAIKLLRGYASISDAIPEPREAMVIREIADLFEKDGPPLGTRSDKEATR
ncbi:MAG: hypothetical protein ACRDQZ_03100 [Mycobacteriales bacterium]